MNKNTIRFKELNEAAKEAEKEMIELQEKLKKLGKIQVVHPKHKFKLKPNETKAVNNETFWNKVIRNFEAQKNLR